MHPQRLHEASADLAPSSADATNEQEMPIEWAWTAQERAALLWLRRWYQSGGSDRASIVHHLEFLKLLVSSGKLAL